VNGVPTADDVAAYLAARTNHLAAPEDIEYLTGGEQHILMVVRPAGAAGDPVLLRVPRTLGERQRAKARREVDALARLPADIAPRLYWFDETGLGSAPTIATQLVDGQSSRLRELAPDRARALGQTLARVHSVPVTPAERSQGHLAALLLRRIAAEVDTRLSTPDVLAVPAARATARRLLGYHALVLRQVVEALQTGVFRGSGTAFCH
jgi:aminoglycoside phosphotransferase (APT) family kinase protein